MVSRMQKDSMEVLGKLCFWSEDIANYYKKNVGCAGDENQELFYDKMTMKEK